MKRKGAGFIFIVISICFTGSLSAQVKKQLTLNDAINLGVQNSKQLQLNKEKILEAAAAVKEAVEKKLPDAGVSGAYMRLMGSNIKMKGEPNNGGSGSNTAMPDISQAVYGIMNISLPLYAGGRIRLGIESSRYLEQAARLDADNNKDEEIQNIIEAFANLYKSASAVKLVQDNLQQSRQREKDFSNLEKNGLLARNDLLKAQLQTSNIELSLLDAQNNLQMATVNMDLMLGLPAHTELELDTTGIEKREDDRTLEDFLQAATTNRKDIQAISYRKKAAATLVKATEAQLYPNLQLTGGYIAADIPKFFSITNAVNLGVGVSYNIGSLWKTKAKVQQAEAKEREMALTEQMMGDVLQLQVNKSYLNLLSSRKKIDVYIKAVEQASENYKIVKNKFDNSLATTTDLLEADVAQFQAKLNYTFAKADAFVAYHKLLQTAGILSSGLEK